MFRKLALVTVYLYFLSTLVMAGEVRKLGSNDLEWATPNQGAATTTVSPGGVTVTKIDAAHIPFRSANGYADNLVDSSYSLTPKVADLIAKGPWVDVRATPYNIILDNADASVMTANASALNTLFATNKPVLLPIGTIHYNANVKLPTLNGYIFGLGKGSILQYHGTGEALTRDVVSDTPQRTFLTLSNFQLLATDNTQTIGIALKDAYHVVIENLYIKGASTGFTTAGINIVGRAPINAANIRIVNNDIRLCAGDGIKVTGDGGVQLIHIIGNMIQSNTGLAINVVSTGTTVINQLNIIGNDLEGNAGGGIFAGTLLYSLIIGNDFEFSTGVTTTPLSIGSTGVSRGVTIANNMFTSGNPTTAVILGGTTADKYIDGVDIFGNILSVGSTAAITLQVHKNVSMRANSLNNGVTYFTNAGYSPDYVVVQTGGYTTQTDNVYINKTTLSALNSRNNANNGYLSLIGTDNNDRVVIGGQTNTADSGLLMRMGYRSIGAFGAGSADMNGTIGISADNNAIIFYSGGNRYKVTGTGF